MKTGEISWVVVKGTKGRPVGALGFVRQSDGSERAAIIAPFLDDRDGNEDGAVSFGERAASMLAFGMKGRAINIVAREAYADPDILERDPTFGQLRGSVLTAFAYNLVLDGIYLAYLKFPISQAAGAVVKNFFVRKGFEMAVKKSLDHLLKNEVPNAR